MISKIKKNLSLIMLLGAMLLLSGCPPRNDKLYPVAEEEYLLGWVLHNINDSTPTDVSYSDSDLAVYNYTYNYPAGSPPTYYNVLFWIAPFQYMAATSNVRLSVPENRVYYLKGDEVSNPIYRHGWSFSNFMQISYFTSEYFGMQEHYKSEDSFYAIKPVPGQKEHIYFGTSPFTPASISMSNENNNNIIRLNDRLLRGYDGKSYLNRMTSYLTFNDGEWSRINLLSQPTYKIYHNKDLLAEGNLTDYYGNWDYKQLVYALDEIGRYSVDVEIPSDYPLFNITRISAVFSYEKNAIELPILKHIEFPAGFRINEILPISVEFENENTINNVLMYYKTDAMQDWAFLANSRNAELLIKDANAAKIDFRFIASTNYGFVTYDIFPISLRKIGIECPYFISESKGGGYVINGRCADNNHNYAEGLKLEFYANGGYLGAAMTGEFGDYELSVENVEQKIEKVDIRFKGTGLLVQKPSINVVSPNGREVWQIGSNQTILWESKDMPPTSNIEVIRLRDDKTRQEFKLIENTVNDGVEEINVPDLPSGSYWLEIKTSLDGESISDGSDFTFSISHPIKCTDSDRGKDYYVKGNLSIDSDIVFTDSCNKPGGISEGWCNYNFDGKGNDRWMVEDAPCPSGCREGACVCETNKDCGAINCIRAPCPSYSCINEKCIISTCGNNVCEEGEEKSCPQDCQKTCTDSDGGKNYYVGGTVSYGNEIVTDFCWNYDKGSYCQGNEEGCVLAEHYCTENGIGKETYKCPNGCFSGSTGSACAVRDENRALMKDMYFVVKNINATKQSIFQYKGSDKIKNDNPTLKFKNIESGGTIEQVYADSKPLATLKAEGFDYGVYSAPRADIDTNDFDIQVDLNGDGALQSLCTDSDNGRDYNTKGEITFNSQLVFTDWCNQPDRLSEGWCDYNFDGKGNDRWMVEDAPCPSGCREGACIKVIVCGNKACEQDEETTCPQDCIPEEIEVKEPSSFSLSKRQSAKVVNYKDTKIRLDDIIENPPAGGGGGKAPPPPPAAIAKMTISNSEFSKEYDIIQGTSADAQQLRIAFNEILNVNATKKSAMFNITVYPYCNALGRYDEDGNIAGYKKCDPNESKCTHVCDIESGDERDNLVNCKTECIQNG